MAIHTRENLYRGVNAHLHSYFQRQTGWAGFHGQHLVDLLRAIQALLPVESGYVADTEASLQISHYDPVDERLVRSYSKPDTAIFKPRSGSYRANDAPAQLATPTASLPVSVTITEPEDVLGIVVYRVEADGVVAKPVTRIELLSPANKPPRSHYPFYMQKRSETLASGIKLVEIDYLHEQRSPLMALPSYPHREADSYPYTILISDPTPSLAQGKTDVYGFRVDDVIPVVALPLVGSDAIIIDMGAVYDMTYAANIRYGIYTVDYAELPPGFDTYDAIDQQRIQARMAAAAQLMSQPMPPTQE